MWVLGGGTHTAGRGERLGEGGGDGGGNGGGSGQRLKRMGRLRGIDQNTDG